jgi:hypothetical protein
VLPVLVFVISIPRQHRRRDDRRHSGRTVFRGNVHLSSSPPSWPRPTPGAGSVIGDTTTTMIWLDGVSPLAVVPAYVASIAAFSYCFRRTPAAPAFAHPQESRPRWP